MNTILGSVIDIYASESFAFDDLAISKFITVPMGSNVIWGTVVNGVLGVALSDNPNLSNVIANQWYGFFTNVFMFPLPKQTSSKRITLQSIGAVPMLATIHVGKITTKDLPSSDQVVVSRIAR